MPLLSLSYRPYNIKRLTFLPDWSLLISQVETQKILLLSVGPRRDEPNTVLGTGRWLCFNSHISQRKYKTTHGSDASSICRIHIPKEQSVRSNLEKLTHSPKITKSIGRKSGTEPLATWSSFCLWIPILDCSTLCYEQITQQKLLLSMDSVDL